MSRNGELRVLKILAGFQPKCLLDVGANRGEWTKLAASFLPDAKIYAFEIVPSTFEMMSRELKDRHNTTCLNYGLSDEDSFITIRLGEDSTMATACQIAAMRQHDEYYTNAVEGRIRRAENVMAEYSLKAVDFVKIDTEGMDLKVIRGFGERLIDVRAVQFEYGIFNIASHDLLADYWQHLEKYGFKVGKIYPNAVLFMDYHFELENFYGSNYIAIKRDNYELMQALCGNRGN